MSDAPSIELQKPNSQAQTPPVALSGVLNRIIPNAVLNRQTLPNTPIQLWLIEPNFDSHALTREVIDNIWQNVPYWIFCWASGLALARQILAAPQKVAGKCVLDFGTGSGVVAIAAKLAGAKHVIACDTDPFSLEATRQNAILNGVTLEYADDVNKLNDTYDILTAADVLYDMQNYAFLELFFTKAHTVMLADSRVKNFNHMHYIKIGEVQASTFPDLDEANEFRRVSFYQGSKSR